MEADGADLKGALGDLVGQAQDAGGASANDPAARAISEGMDLAKRSGSGNPLGSLMSTVQSMGQDNMFDPHIKALQSQGEKSGYTPELKDKINSLRQAQSGAALDARALGAFNISQSGGGSGGYGGGGGGAQMTGGGLEALAQLLGKYKGNLQYNDATSGVGIDPRHRSAVMGEDGAMVDQLNPVYQEMMRGEKLQNDTLEEQLTKAKQSDMSSAGGGGMVDATPQMAPGLRMYGGGNGSWGSQWNNGGMPGDLAALRRAALASALRSVKRF